MDDLTIPCRHEPVSRQQRRHLRRLNRLEDANGTTTIESIESKTNFLRPFASAHIESRVATAARAGPWSLGFLAFGRSRTATILKESASAQTV